MKNVWHIIIYAALAGTAMSCVRESLSEDSETKEPFNIEAFSDGYSVAFELDLDPMGGDAATRADNVDNSQIEAWENYINPEEFRILFFDAEENFLFESKTRWFTQIEAYHGSSRWRVGVPIFSYLNDNYDENISSSDDLSVSEAYDWERIAEIMRTKPFKIAIMANRPSDIAIPTLSDLSEEQKNVERFGKNGPFWSPINSIAHYNDLELQDHLNDIKKIFDLHHCQYDPFYENKNNGEGEAYRFLFDYDYETMKGGTEKLVPFMGAVSGWLHPEKERHYGDNKVRYFYRLPESRMDEKFFYNENKKNQDDNQYDLNCTNNIKNQYIPMYGVQQFDALTGWTKGTTYNLSEQVGSQTGNYDYKSISLLRSVVKLELRIPKVDNNGNTVTVNNTWAQLCANNFMARCEPMDVWTPTNEIWKDHTTDCEWRDIRNYGLYMRKDDDAGTKYKERLSWFFGVWDKDNKWKINGVDNITLPQEEGEYGKQEYPRIFNPITQRLQISFITDCYLETEDYHRWIIYCGERNMNDPNKLNNLKPDASNDAYVSFFRIGVTRGNTPYVYYIPITDYSQPDNPAKDYLIQTFTGAQQKSQQEEELKEISSYPAHMKNYYTDVLNTDPRNYPYPLLRNHMYRLTVSFGNGNDIDVHILDGEKRVVGGIEFN